MPEVLLDSSAYIDLEKANKHRRETWAITTLRDAINYHGSFGNPFLSAISVVEILRGLHRDADPSKAIMFRRQVANDFNILDFDIEDGFIAGEIIERLEAARKIIGVSDCLIAATAIHRGLTLVTSNTRHFQRIADLGYPLSLENWRDL